MIIYHDVEQGTPAWFKLREGLPATAQWRSDYISRQGLYRAKNYRFLAHRRGHSLEIVAIREYERAYHTKVKLPGFVTNTVYTNAGYSPDGIDGAWLLECKAFEGKARRYGC